MKLKFFSYSILFILSSLAHADIGMSGMISNQITRTVNDGIAKNLFDNLIIPQLKVKNSSGSIIDMQQSSKQRFLSLLLEDGTVRIWDLKVGVQRPMIKAKNGIISAFAADALQDTLYIVNDTSIDAYDFLTAKPLSSFSTTINDIKKISYSSSNSTFVLADKKNNLSALHTKSQKQLWDTPVSSGDIQKIRINPSTEVLAILVRKPTLFSFSERLEIRSLSNGSISKVLDNNGGKISSFQFSQANILEAIYENGDIINWNTATGEQISSKNTGHSIIAVSKTPNGITAYVIDKNTISIINQTGETLSHITKEGIGTQSIKLLANGNKLLTVSHDGKAFLWDTKTATKVLQIISTKQGWSIVDNLGRFDSSEKGMPNISWEAEDKEIPIDSFSKKYYEPGLLATTLKDESYLNKNPDAIKKGITLPPELKVVVQDIKTTGQFAELTVEVYGQGGGIEDVNLYHNTKIIRKDKTIVKDKSFVKNNREHRSMKMRVTPVNGVNSVKVIASNKMGIEGQSKELQFEIKKADKQPILRVITIAVNQYKDAQLNLDYSVPDAQTIANILNNNEFSKFRNVEKRQLYNASATKMSIISELVNLSNGAKNDVLAIYFAGHGISINGEWYFLPYETELQADMNYFASVGISASDLSSIFVDSNIQHILLMIDACYSGASVDSFRRLQNSQRHFSRDISKSVGITVVTATRKDQEAAELSELGHGLFTYVLSKGMNGEADWWPKNKEISAHELAKFSTDTIPLFSKKYLGSAQEPTAFTMGKDFSLLSIKK